MIAAEQWAAWSKLLDAALDLDAAARPAWLAALRLRDPLAADTVQRLLGHEADDDALPGAGRLFTVSRDARAQAYPQAYPKALEAALGEDPAAAPAAVPGQCFGPWQVSRRLGIGGMGEVWLATRADRLFEGQAAIKLLATSSDARRLGARFARERQLLARLAHPGIARLLDAGMAGEQPYLVLEYVDGRSLIDHVRERAPTAVERIRLAIAIGRAVEYAHSRLVVHRDLKPSNVMVTRAGEVKLLDFGIAAILDDDGAGDTRPGTALTRLHGRGLTLDYAAPEQIAGEATGIACDVYALAVLLFELLAGQRPLRGERPGRAALEHAVLHVKAPRLSRVIGGQRPAGWQPGDQPVDAAKLGSGLDAVLAKALRKAPEDRYPTMTALLADLENWLAHRPLTAAPGDWRYRAGLWLRRNRLPASLGAAVGLSLSIGLGLSLWQWQRAVLEARKSEAVQGFLVSLFRASDNWENQGQEPTLRSVVEGSAQRVEQELAAMPDVQLTLNEVLMSTYQGLGDYKASEAIARRSILLAEQVHGRDSEVRARFLNTLANNLIDSGRYDEAAGLLVEALRIVARRHGAESLEVADLQNDLAAVEASRGHLQEAVRLRREALRRFERDPAASAAEVGRIRGDLGVSLDRAGLWREAEATHRIGYDQAQASTAPKALRYSSLPHNLGSILRRLGKYPEAERLLLEAIAIRRQEAADHPYLGLSLRNLALLQAETGRLAVAARTLADALAILNRKYGAGSVTVVITEIQQALLSARRNPADAEAAEAIVRAALPRLGADTPLEQARGQQMLGEVLLLRPGHGDEAREQLAGAVARFDGIEGVEHPEAAIALGLLGIAELRSGAAAAGRQHLATAIERLSRQVAPEQALLLQLRRALAGS